MELVDVVMTSFHEVLMALDVVEFMRFVTGERCEKSGVRILARIL